MKTDEINVGHEVYYLDRELNVRCDRIRTKRESMTRIETHLNGAIKEYKIGVICGLLHSGLDLADYELYKTAELAEMQALKCARDVYSRNANIRHEQ